MSAAPADERFPLAEAIIERISDDRYNIEQGTPNAFMNAVTSVTQELLRWWFQFDYRDSRDANFHTGQRDAILAIIYAHEVLNSTSLYDLYNQMRPDALLADGRLGRVTNSENAHPKYAAKMATGTGKTWVLNALLIWQYLNHRANPSDTRFSANFLVVAPGLVVYERLLDSFLGKIPAGSPTHAGGKQRAFETSDIYVNRELFLPPDRRNGVFSFVQTSVATKGEIGRKVTGGGVIAITNWHVLTGEEDPEFLDDELEIDAPGEDLDERAAATSFVPLTPGTTAGNSLETLDRRYARGGALDWLVNLPSLVVFNDEAHHIHQFKRGDEVVDVVWQRSLSRIAATKAARFVQIDFSATPYNEQGTGLRAKRLYFDHIVVDFPLHAAMSEGLVKALAIDKRSEVASISNDDLEFRVERDESGTVLSLSEGQRTMIRAGLAKLAILEEQFIPHDPYKHPKLLIMTEDTNASKVVVEFLAECGLTEDEVLRVDSNRKGEVGEKEWGPIKEKLFGIDVLAEPKVVVSVLMLREGFDVNNICVIVPLRSAGSGILAEQTIGRGLRLMWRGDEAIEDLKRESRKRIHNRQAPTNYLDVLFIVEHPRFVNLYEELLGEGLAIELTTEITQVSVTGDLETLELRTDYRAFDFEIPVILRDAEEELRAPSVDVARMPISKYPIADLLNQIGKGDRFASEDAQTKTRFGDYRVDGGVMTATGYNDYLARITNRLTESLSRTFIGAEGHDRGQYTRTAQYPLLQTFKPLIVGWVDHYIRERAFGQGFDPLLGENWRVLLVGDVSEDLAANFSSALVDLLDNAQVDTAQIDHHWVSEISTVKVRSSAAVPVHKSIFEKLPVPPRGGGLERLFIEWADSDASVEAIAKIDEFRHWFLHRPYLKADGMPAYYSPDFLVRTADGLFLVETKGQNLVNEANVQRKRRSALAWVEQVNALDADERGGLLWSYVLLGGQKIDEWRTKGASVAQLLGQARLLEQTATVQPTLL
ncbi:MAG: restriction endonuclease subunit R [Salinibacterium sp.]|nr:MAG: restriction endonuclease subunit R [Salinibacterium sp.]